MNGEKPGGQPCPGYALCPQRLDDWARQPEKLAEGNRSTSGELRTAQLFDQAFVQSRHHLS